MIGGNHASQESRKSSGRPPWSLVDHDPRTSRPPDAPTATTTHTMLTMPATLTPHTDHRPPHTDHLTPTDLPTTDHHNSRQKSMQHAAAPFTRCKLYRLCILSPHMYRLCTQLCNWCSQCMQFAVTNERTSTTEHRRRRPRVRSFVRSFVRLLFVSIAWLVDWLVMVRRCVGQWVTDGRRPSVGWWVRSCVGRVVDGLVGGFVRGFACASFGCRSSMTFVDLTSVCLSVCLSSSLLIFFFLFF